MHYIVAQEENAKRVGKNYLRNVRGIDNRSEKLQYDCSKYHRVVEKGANVRDERYVDDESTNNPKYSRQNRVLQLWRDFDDYNRDEEHKSKKYLNDSLGTRSHLVYASSIETFRYEKRYYDKCREDSNMIEAWRKKIRRIYLATTKYKLVIFITTNEWLIRV